MKWVALIIFIILNQLWLWYFFSSPLMNIINLIGWGVALKLTVWRKKHV